MAKSLHVNIVGDAKSLIAACKKAELSLMSMGKVAGAAGLLIAGGLAVGLTKSVKAAMEFQSSMELISTQAGASTQEVKKMSKALLDLAPAVGTTPNDLAKGLFHIESSGYRGAKALSVLKLAAEGAAVGHADLEAVTNALVAAEHSGIKGLGDMSHAMGSLNAIVGAGNMRMEDLAGALSSGILPTAKAFGLSISDVGGALATMTRNGVPAVDAATRLRMTFTLMAAPTDKAIKQLKTIGISSSELANTMRSKGLFAALQELKQHLSASGLSATQTAALLGRAFGARSSSAILTLLGSLKDLRSAQDSIKTGASGFGKNWEDTTKTAEFRTKQFHAAVKTLEIGIGAGLLPIVTRVVSAFARFATFLSTHETLTQAMVIGFAALAAAMIALSVASMIAATGMSAFWIAATGGLILLVPLIAAAAIEIAKHWDAIKAAIGTAVNAIVGAFHSMVNAARTAISAVTAAFNSVKTAIMTAVNAVVNFVTSHWPLLLAPITLGMSLIVGFVVSHWSQIRSAFSSGINAVVNVVRTGFNAVVNAVRTAVGTVTAAAHTVGQGILNGIRSGVSHIASIVTNAMSAVKNALISAAGEAFGLAVSIGRAIISGVLSGLSGLAGAVSAKIHGAISAGVHLAGSILHGSGEFEFTRYTIGKPMIDGAVKGIQENGWKLVKAVKDTVSAAGTLSPIEIPVDLQIAETQAELTGDVGAQISALQNEAVFLSNLASELDPHSKRYLDVIQMLLGVNNQIKSLITNQDNQADSASAAGTVSVASAQSQVAANEPLIASQQEVAGAIRITQNAAAALKNALAGARDQAGGLKEALLKLDGTHADTFLTQHIRSIYDGTSNGGDSTDMGSGSSAGGKTPRLAGGGPVSIGKPYFVGEEGMELFVPSSNGRIVPNNKLSTGGGGLTIEKIVVQGSVVSERELVSNVRDGMLREMRRLGTGDYLGGGS